jgi:hypothetical protein
MSVGMFITYEQLFINKKGFLNPFYFKKLQVILKS